MLRCPPTFTQVYENLQEATRFWIKGSRFSIAGLLGQAGRACEEGEGSDRRLDTPSASGHLSELSLDADGAAAEADPAPPVDASTFSNGTLAIFRLAPQDYHRFHAPLGGTVLGITDIPGCYYTVNPIAIHSEFANVFTENRRAVLWLETPAFGVAAFVAVGATLVGSILWSVAPGDRVRKGDELGCFAFGGSTCVLIVPDAHPVIWDTDLLDYGCGWFGRRRWCKLGTKW